MTQPSEEARKATLEQAAWLVAGYYSAFGGLLDKLSRDIRALNAIDAPRVPPSGEALNDAAYDAAWRAAFPHLPGEVRGNIESGVEAAITAYLQHAAPVSGEARALLERLVTALDRIAEYEHSETCRATHGFFRKKTRDPENCTQCVAKNERDAAMDDIRSFLASLREGK